MPTPNFGLPLYGPTDTAKLDTLLNGQSTALDAALLQAQTDWFAKLPFAMAAGVTNVDTTFPTVQLPVGRFTVPPIVVAQIYSGAGSLVGYSALVTNVTTTSFQARIAHPTNSDPRSSNIFWIAVQMTENDSAG